jgi:hypothetical protein
MLTPPADRGLRLQIQKSLSGTQGDPYTYLKHPQLIELKIPYPKDMKY